jgi:hypothetical protein
MSRVEKVFFLISLLLFMDIGCTRELTGEKKNINTSSSSTLEYYESAKSFNELFSKIGEIHLSTDAHCVLSIMPILSGLNNDGEFIILDNVGKRQLLIFDSDGKYKASIGGEGRGKTQFLFPDNVFYRSKTQKYYVYDGDLLRVQEYNRDFMFNRSFPLPLFIEALAISDDDRIFCYSSGTASIKGADKVVYECDWQGKIRNSFCNQATTFSAYAESKGGGILLANKYIYVITPYEYAIRQYTLDGKAIMSIKGSSNNYVPLSIKPKMPVSFEDLNERMSFHATWSHIRQILKIGNMIGIVFAEPGERRVFLDLYDYDLGPITGDILLPKYLGLGGVYSQGDILYLLSPSLETKGHPSNPIVTAYKLKSDGKSIKPKVIN